MHNASISPVQIVSWLRSYAKELSSTADSLERTFAGLAALGGASIKAQESSPELELSMKGPTQEQFTAAVKEKTGRIANLAARLKTSSAVIEQLLAEPACRVMVAHRGWLQLKEA